MSVDILQSVFSNPNEIAHENISLANDSVSKCAEIFVTKNADKWTFFCDYCRMATSDIGVFICHIRLEHLNVQADLTQNNPTDTTLQENTHPKCPEEITTKVQQQPVLRDIIKIEPTTTSNHEYLQHISKITDSTSLKQPASNESKKLNATKNSTQNTQHSSREMNQSFFTIIPIDRQQKQFTPEPHKEAISEIVYKQKAAAAKSEYELYEFNKDDENEDVHDYDSVSYSSPNEDGDDTDYESNDDNETGCSKPKIARKSKAVTDDCDLAPVKCQYCTALFKNKHSVAGHILRNHDKELPIKCEKCQKGFLTTNGLKTHLKYHECPVCKTEHPECFFLTHVLTHEGDRCFPCQVCGEIYNSYYERLKHWKTHAKEKPFACRTCYRRYAKPHHLKRHLKSHNQYHCDFCLVEFNSPKALRPPHVCTNCGKLPDIKKKLDHLNSLIDSNDALDAEMNLNITSKTSDKVAPEIPANKQTIEEKASLENKLIQNSDSTIIDGDNNGSNTNFSCTLNDTYDSDNDNILNKDDSNLDYIDDTLDIIPTITPTNAVSLLYKCKYCETALSSKQLLEIHIERQHISNMNQISSKFKCPQCQREFQSRSTLCQHIKAHDKKNLLKCPVCPSRKFGEGLFIAHVMSHENETCFPCQVCGKIFVSNEERITHWKTHIEERPHGCTICFRRFTHKSILTRHMKTHRLSSS